MSDRRRFLFTLSSLVAAGVLRPLAAAPERDRLGELLPTRPLGRTGQQVTMLGLGGWHIGRMDEREAEATIEAALEGGVRFFDTAESYQDGLSETRLGRFLIPRYRDAVYVMTKTTATDAATARRHLDESMRRLRVDRLDLWQMHSVTSPEDVERRLANGVLDVILEARASGKVRHVGFTGHSRPSAHRRVLDRTDSFEVCQMPVNLSDASFQSFIDGVLPTLTERRMGVLAMKTLANGGFFGGSQHGEHGDNPKLVPDRVSIDEAIRFVWTLPVSVLITGADDAAQLKQKIALARSFAPLDDAARKQLIARCAELAGPKVEFYKET